MATQSGLANLKVIGPIDLPNNSDTVIHTMERSGLVFANPVAFANQDLPVQGVVYWRNDATAEPNQYHNFILWGNATESLLGAVNRHAAFGFVPQGAQIRQNRMRSGSNYVRVYLYILEFDDNVPNFGSN